MVESTYIRAGAFHDPIMAIRSEFGSKANLLRDVGLSSDLLSRPESLIETDTFIKLIDRCTFISADPEFMLRQGLELCLPSFGLAGQAVVCAPTVLESILVMQDVIQYIQSNSRFEIETRNTRTRIHYINWHDNAEEFKLDVQYTIGIVANLISQPDYPFDPAIKIYYPGAKLNSFSNKGKNFQIAGSSFGFVQFDSRALHFAMPSKDLEHFEILKRFVAAHMLENSAGMSLTETVKELIFSSFDIALLSEPKLATILGMNTRMLRRRLQAEGSNYRNILQEARQAVAMDDLAAGKSVTETALKLGYEHPQNFTSAFQSWTGTKPSSFQRVPSAN